MSKLPSIDLSDLPGFGEILPGKYLAEVVRVEESTSQKGKPMLVWEWKIIRGDFRGRTLFYYTSLQDHMINTLGQCLKALGYRGTVNLTTEDLIGKRAWLKVEMRVVTENGIKKEYPRISEVLPYKQSNKVIVTDGTDDDDD